MPERWQSELEKVDLLNPAENLQDRIGHVPTLERRESPGRRIVVGLIALAIFAAAGLFAWRVFDPGSQRGQTTDMPAQPSPEGALSAAGLTASCGGSAFDRLPPDTSALTPFTSFDELDLSKVGGEAPFLKEFVSNYDWFVTQEGDGWRQLFGQPVGHRSDPPYASMRIEKGDGGWAPVGWGQCRIEVAAEGWGNARFVIDPKSRPDSNADQISVLATENACAGGQAPDGREVRPVVLSEDAHTISIVILVEPTQGGADCPSNPAFPVEVQLGSAIGDRDIVDASVYPPERQWP